MLTATRQLDGRKVGAWEAEKGEGPFECFCCRQVVTLRKGRIIAAHFAHQPPVACEYGAGESEEHRRCKLALHAALAADPRVEKCELERDLGTVRPDVSAYVGGVPVAFEVQLSSLSLERIAYRTAEYTRKGIYVLWLPVRREGLRRALYAPRPW
ncbi:MAG TPA: competence protein CoiA family protein, partial [Pyrinomonadaceae bacterium]|nr:competence protein CoiA family protein [Pyrinomonadaceae bacterium]